MNLALIAAAVAGVQVGAAIVASRFVIAEIPPLTLALLRYAIALLCLLPFVVRYLVRGKARLAPPPSRRLGRDALVMAVLGIGQFALLIALLNWGLQSVGAAQAALIFSLFPLLTLLLSAALGRERITVPLLGGVLLSTAGVALSLVPQLETSSAAAHGWLGQLAVLASAGVGALCSVSYRPYLQRYPTLLVSAYAMLASVLCLALLALPEHWPARVLTLAPTAWAVVAFIGLSSGFGYVAWLYALRHEAPTRVTVFLALNPVTAAVLGALFLHEKLDAWTLAAIVCIGAGLRLATWPAFTR